ALEIYGCSKTISIQGDSFGTVLVI
ncbi:hypothetical protein BVRB_034040, partial [Beta vulgaris subsp. vulgaris]